MDVNSYLSGYTDGEGCFCVTFNRSNRHKFGWDIRPSFSVSQNGERSEVLRIFQETFECGTIRPDRSDKTLKYEVRSVDDLVKRIIPHFRKYPLLSSKRADFEMFAQLCELMHQKKHLLHEGFLEAQEISTHINTSGKKKYPRQEIKI